MTLTQLQRKNLELYRTFREKPPTDFNMLWRILAKQWFLVILLIALILYAYFVREQVAWAAFWLGLLIGRLMRDIDRAYSFVKDYPGVTRKQKGKGKKKKQRRRYRAEWREPKVLIIFEMDAQGRMKAGTRPWIDGTFAGPDEAMELLAFHLHQLGAGAAEVVVFVADGAPWIWERLAWVERRVGLSAAQAVRVLDFYHAAHNVSLALETLGLAEPQRRRLFRKLKRWLRRGWPGLVVQELERLGIEAGWPEELEQPLEYLRKHMEARHLDYDHYRHRGLPLGSGAVESAIRRVVNLRLKGAGLIWLKDNAEGALVLRAAALTGRWDETMIRVREAMGKDRRIDWQWTSADLVAELKTPELIKPPKAQDTMGQDNQAEAA